MIRLACLVYLVMNVVVRLYKDVGIF